MNPIQILFVFHDDDEVKKLSNIPIIASIPYYSALQGIRENSKNILKIMEDPSSKNKKDKEENIKDKNYESFIIQDAFRNFFTSSGKSLLIFEFSSVNFLPADIIFLKFSSL